ncbi:erythrocyte membrane protein 1 [Plasmodium falciparum RAJ116]|uniref:Erythrocyte membrane protein 1 n=1 Tax=Plasmodium falciparum RAJ116 TaxID=580058 RepID=A0A0L0CRX4_PLAFA|nr:erythrocyte membrane protein 1 [Plasmodium falciparum RAJ116]
MSTPGAPRGGGGAAGSSGGGGRGGSGGGGNDYSDAKHLLDSIGEEVYKEKVKSESNGFKDDLKGDLQKATNRSGETVSSNKPCELVKEYYTKRLGGNNNRHPCNELSGNDVDRFSDKIGGQCTDSKMRSGGKGACAPYRRLHLCHHNLETIETTSTAKHDLLAEVCYAAKEEGESLKNYHAQYDAKYKDYGSTICTVLARSFADIGDIVRGKDLFLGNTYESAQREKLDDKLKKIFGDIYKELSTTKNGAQTYYQDKSGGNFFKLREDWWTANRHTVWEAITCSAAGGSQYFRQTYFRATCSDSGDNRGGAQARNKCRCNGANVVPTYFDYVPQYLRWFEEWAEDFCRLRKRKLKDAIDKCRGKNGKDKYCSGNGYDCEQTIRGDEHFVEGECHKCSVVCTPFVKWIDNQKQEFLKQKEKCRNEIPSSKRQKRSIRSGSDGNKYDGYEKNFYEQLKKSGYGTVNKFLQLLNNETTCTKNGDIEEEGKIDFKTVKRSSDSGDDSNKTFYRTKYCQACPWCGAEKESGGGGWKDRQDTECGKGKDYSNYNDTEIPILTGDKTKGDMVKKYNKFCNGNGGNGAPAAAPDTATIGDNSDNATTGYCGGTNNSDKVPSLCEKWICYYKKKNENSDGKKDINFCVLQNNETVRSKKNSMHYNAFFWKWVHDMLIDSIEWRTQLGNCINKDNGNTCIRGCKKKCDCFLKWVNEKKTEWTNIKKHFYKQDMGSGVYGNFGHDYVLETLLKKEELLKIIEETYGNTEETKHIEELLKETGVVGGKDNTTIDKLLNHEKDEADKCLKTHKDDCKQQQDDTSGGRAGQPRAEVDEAGEEPDSEEEEEEEDEEEDEVEESEEEVKETEAEAPKVDDVNVCETVKNALADTGSLTQACNLKYGGNNSRLGWKCIPSGDSGVTGTRGSDATTGKSDASGSICVPPRRRRL